MYRLIENLFGTLAWAAGAAGGGMIMAQATVEVSHADSYVEIVRELGITGFALLVFMGVAWFCRRVVLFWEEHGRTIVEQWIANQKSHREDAERRIELQAKFAQMLDSQNEMLMQHSQALESMHVSLARVIELVDRRDSGGEKSDN